MPTPTPEPTFLPGSPPYIGWRIGDDVSLEYSDEAIEAVRLLDEYAKSLELPQIDGRITFYLYNYGDELVEAYSMESGWSLEQTRTYWEKGSTAVASRGWIVLNVSVEWYVEGPRESRMKVIAHELIHAGYQYGQSGLSVGGANNRVPDGGPRWLSEGSAEFLAYQALSAGGVLSYQTERQSKDPWGFVEHAKGVDKQLRDIETQDGFNSVRGSPYKYSLMAAELLASPPASVRSSITIACCNRERPGRWRLRRPSA